MNPLIDLYIDNDEHEKEVPPDYLYHYTSLSTLALILESKTLRFTRLDLVNDPTEASTNVDNTNQLIFASCWTAEEQDELSMWKIYSPHKLGVRIKLPRHPFSGRDPRTINLNGGSYRVTKVDIEVERRNSIDKSSQVYGPNSIKYTDDTEALITKCYHKIESLELLTLLEVGLFKSTCWSFEKEWRYRFLAIPFALAHNRTTQIIKNTLDVTNNPVMTRYVDIPLKQSALEKLEITLYPDPDPALRLLVEALLHKHGINAPVKDSALKVKW